LQILGNQKAKLSLKGNLVNDLEDLNDVEVNFVVGVPSFKYRNVQDPVASWMHFQGLLNAINQAENRQQTDYIVRFDPETYEEQIVAKNSTADVEGLRNEDLFFYQKKKLSLEKDSRVLINLFEAEIEYKDVYTVVLKRNEESRNRYGNNSKEGKRNIVWHSLIFDNKTNYPLTAGSVFFLKKEGDSNLPISQNEIEHTPSKATVDVKMAVATDIVVMDADKEIKRDENARMKSDLGWETISLTTQLNSRNPHNKATWEFELKAGETKKITYTYQVYVM